MMILCTVLSMVVAYLLGSINFAIVVTCLLRHEDIRTMGSGNAGMTNVLRNLGKGPAVLTFLGDFLKGFVAVLLAKFFCQTMLGDIPVLLLYLTALGAVLGHTFPLYYHFKGGKGIVVSVGALCAIATIPILCCIAAFAIAVALTKTVSVGSIAACITFPIVLAITRWLQQDPEMVPEVILGVLIAGFIIFMHRGNIKRLLNGEENSFKK